MKIEQTEDMVTEVYRITGYAGTVASAVCRCKNKFSDDKGIPFSEITARKLHEPEESNVSGREILVAVVAPEREAHAEAPNP